MQHFKGDSNVWKCVAGGFALGVVAGIGIAHLYTPSWCAEGKSSSEREKPIPGSLASVPHCPKGEVAKSLGAVIPYYPFKGIERFYDIGGFLKNPDVFRQVVLIMVDRYRGMKIDAIGGIDARGFVLGPPVALALGVPFFMLRKKGKMPNAVLGSEYQKEYKGDNAHGSDALGIPRGAVKKGDRVLLIDDLVATGGTMIAAINLVKMFEATVVETACVVELRALNARASFDKAGHSDVPIWYIVDESVLTLKGELPEGYVDDGEAH